MKFIILCLTFIYCIAAVAAEKSGLEGIIEKGSVYASLVVLVIEFLIANTKLIKANSTIDLILDIIKFIFKIKKDESK